MERVKKAKNRIAIERDRALVNRTLRGYIGKLKGPRVLKKAMEYAVFSGGKRLRPILTIEASRTLSGDVKKTLPFACAVELVHNFSLIHDDLPAMDNDDKRRGKPTCHKKFGEALAILAGDGLLNLAFGIISKVKQKKTLEIASLLSGAIGAENMIGGQVLDLGCEKGLEKTPKLKHKINRMKTAGLMGSACEIGALAAAAKNRDAERMREFGINLGLAFQIADDIEDSRHKLPMLNKMRKEAKLFISRGKTHIAPFKEKAGVLKYIAEGVLKRV